MDTLLRLVPPIRRIRGSRLYAADGRRFMDMWLDDGRSILGEREKVVRTAAANAADKGLTRPYPSLYERRFVAMLMRHAPAIWGGACRAIYMFESAPEAKKAALDMCGDFYAARPFETLPSQCSLYMPRFPLPAVWEPACLIACSETAAPRASYPVPAQKLLAACKALTELLRLSERAYNEAHWFDFERRLGDFFNRQGPYLWPRVPENKYNDFFKKALAGGALLSPRFDAPSVIPPEYSSGELARLARTLAE